MNLATSHFHASLAFVLIQAVVGSFCARSGVAADRSDQLVTQVLFGDGAIAQNVSTVSKQARQLELNDQYEFLLDWVLPSMSHDTIRMSARIESADSGMLPRSQSDSENRQRPLFRGAGTKLICPAIDLVDVAAKLGHLQELRRRVVDIPDSPRPAFRASFASLLLLIDLAREDQAAARSSAEMLTALARNVRDFDEVDQWPFLVAAWAGIRTVAGRSVVADLLLEIHAQQIVEEKTQQPTAATEHFAAMNGQVQKTLIGNSSELPAPFLPSNRWIRSDIVTARSHSAGWPLSMWSRQQDGLQVLSSHQQSLLLYQLPLRGSFDFSCELPSQAADDVCMMYGGVYATPQGEPLQNRRGNIHSDEIIPFAPPITPPGEWAWCRIRVRDGDCTMFYNGRVLSRRTLEDNHDPWLAIRCTSARRLPVIRNVRIDHTPSVPSEVDLCAAPELHGWWSYYGEVVGRNGIWQHTVDDAGQGLTAAREPEFYGTGKESLLCYYRPLREGESLKYDFFYNPGVTEVHPAIGDLAFLLRPDGVALHPVTDGKYEQRMIEPTAAISVAESSASLSALPLKQRAWNQCRVQLLRDSLDIYVNEQLVCSYPIQRQAGQREQQNRFGFFRYAGDSEVLVRNVIWSSQKPAKTFEEIEHQIVSRASNPLDERLAELSTFEHDFGTDGLPTEFFDLPSGRNASVDVQSSGVRHYQKSGGSWTDSSITPTFDLFGDFDFTASFADLTVSAPEYGGCGVVLRIESGDVILLSRRRRKGNLHRVYLTWRVPAGAGEYRLNKDVIISEAPAGRFRIARRDGTYSFHIAENDSPVYRRVVEQKVDGGGEHSVRVELRMIASMGASASARWKSIRMAAEQLKQFRFQVTRDRISESQWNVLAAADSLQELILDGTDVTNDDLLRLKANPEICLLYLKDTAITSAGVRSFSHLKRLEHLHLTATQTDDSAATILAGFSHLQTLGLSYTRVSDETVNRLSVLRELRVLGLARTNVTDASIDSLCSMSALKSVDLRGTRVTRNGFDRLRKALPDCRIRN